MSVWWKSSKTFKRLKRGEKHAFNCEKRSFPFWLWSLEHLQLEFYRPDHAWVEINKVWLSIQFRMISSQSETDAPFAHMSSIQGFSFEGPDYIPSSNEMYLNCCTVVNMSSGFTKQKTSWMKTKHFSSVNFLWSKALSVINTTDTTLEWFKRHQSVTHQSVALNLVLIQLAEKWNFFFFFFFLKIKLATISLALWCDISCAVWGLSVQTSPPWSRYQNDPRLIPS